MLVLQSFYISGEKSSCVIRNHEFTSNQKRKVFFPFAFLSLNRDFDWRRRYYRSEKQKKNEFSFCFSLA
jgi:hypothetical protein